MTSPNLSLSVEEITYCELKEVTSKGNCEVRVKFKIKNLDDTESVPLEIVTRGHKAGKYDASQQIARSRAKLSERLKALVEILEDDEGAWKGLC